MRKETRSKKTICVICGKPITKAQRPSVRMQPGQEAHLECFVKREKEAAKTNWRVRAAHEPRTCALLGFGL